MSIKLFVIVALVQLAFIVGLVLVVLGRRVQRRFFGRARTARRPEVALVFTRWSLGEVPVEDVVRHLRMVTRQAALDETLAAVANRVPAGRLEELSQALRGEAWVAAFLAGASSRLWWHRLAAARALTAAGTERDRPLLARLLGDPLPAVQMAAAGAVERLADRALIARMLDALVTRSLVVRRIQMRTLQATWSLTGPLLLERLAAKADGARLGIWIALADLAADPAAVAAAAVYANHAEMEVRVAVAKLLRHYFHASTTGSLSALLRDSEWPVRAAAARTAGALGDQRLVPLLRGALADGAWWVRFRAALSLAQMGEPGRTALREAAAGPDRFARDMAAMVSGLSGGGVLELAEN